MSAAAAATLASNSDSSSNSGAGEGRLSRYESQKRRDWNSFGQYLRSHRPPLALSRCSGAHVLEFLRYLDQFGKTKVHSAGCPFFGQRCPPGPCPCPLRQAWGSLDALVGRLRAAFEEHGGHPEANPFGARAVRLYLREVRDSQAKARGIAYEKRKRKRPPQVSAASASASAVSTMMHPDLNSMNMGNAGRPSYQYGHVMAPAGPASDEVAVVVVGSRNAAFLPLSVFN